MVKRVRLWCALGLAGIAVLLALTPHTALAATVVQGNNLTISRDRTINDDLYVTGGNLTVDGRINGNLIAAGGNLTLNGPVTGTVIAAGGNLKLNGRVTSSVIAAGGNMTITGRVAHDVTFFGGTLDVAQGAVIGRDIQQAGGSLTINGHVGRNVTSSSGSIQLGSTAVVGGNVSYTGNTKPKIASGAIVRGQVTHHATPGPFPSDQLPVGSGLSVVLWLRTLVGLLAFGLVAVFAAPLLTRRTTERLRQAPWASLGWGVLALLATPVLALLVFLVGLFIGGWWLSLLTLAIYWIALLFGLTVTATLIGRLVLVRTGGGRQELWLPLIIGMVLLLIVSIVPYVGGLVLFVATVLGLGALIAIIGQSLARRQRSVMATEVAPPAGSLS